MKRTVLVTGDTGFVGLALKQAMAGSQNYTVVGFSRENGDLLRFESLDELPPVSRIVHLAGSVGVLQSWEHPRETYQNNILTTLNVLEFARRRQTPVIFMSSYLYGTPQYLPIDETHPISCNNPYAHSKWQTEMLCEAYARDFGISVTILRPFNIYGPGQTADSLISHVVLDAIRKQSIIVKDLRPKRDYLYIGDLVSAIMCVIDSEQNGFEVYNLGFGKSHSVQEVIEIVLQLMKRHMPVTSMEEYRPNEIMDCYCDHLKFSKRFSWAPGVPLEMGIEVVLNSFREQEVESRYV